MKTRLIIGIISVLGFGGLSQAEITVTIPESCGLKTLDYYYAPIKQYATAKTRAERGLKADSVNFVNSKAVIEIPSMADSYMFNLNLNDNEVSLYATPDEKISVDVVSCNPFSYTMHGSALVESINELNSMESPILEKAKALEEAGKGNSKEMEDLSREYTNLNEKYVSENPTSLAAPVALMNLEGESFITAYEALEENMNNSLVFPLAKMQYEREKKALEMEKKQQALQSGEVNAPNFTLKNLEGKEVSLSDFRGKWVILDFWGSWCPWCIKGFPELKEAYEKYAGTLEIIGIDCKESEKEWRAGVEKYQLPWVNLYNPEGTSILSEYGVQGFPTKAIIDPEGKIRNITVGHDPKFFDVLSNLIGK